MGSAAWTAFPIRASMPIVNILKMEPMRGRRHGIEFACLTFMKKRGKSVLAEEVAKVEKMGVREAYLLLGLTLGEEGEMYFSMLGRRYRIKATLHPYQIVIEPFDN